jgi:hypothetical protein
MQETAIDGAVNATFDLVLDQWTKRGQYFVKVTNAQGTVKSQFAWVTMSGIDLKDSFTRTGFFEL